MNCVHCSRVNRSDFVVCAYCGKSQVNSRSAVPATEPGSAPPPLGPDQQKGKDLLPTTRPTFDVTRYLCVAMQLDSQLARKVISGILDDQYRAVASSPGVDLATVIKYALVARRRQRVRDGILAVLEPFLLFFPLIPALLILAWIVVFVETREAYRSVIFPLLSRDNFDPDVAPIPGSSLVRERVNEIAATDYGNVTVFANYLPFVGYGSILNTWSFTLNVAKPEENKQVIPFHVSELYDHVAAEVGRLGLPGVAVENKLFVNGLDLQHEFDPQVQQTILPNPMAAPVPQVSESFIKALRDSPQNRARPYLTVCVTGWEGEIVISIFLRFVLLPQQDLLFVEASYSLLPPLRESYRKVDELISSPTSRQVARMAWHAALRTPGALLSSIPNIIYEIGSPARRRRQRKESIRAIRDHSFNYGSSWNPRESATDKLYYRYFQQLDKEMYLKTAEHRIMDAVTEFMINHNVDVSDLRQRQTTILNSGIYVSGQAQVTTQSMAAGFGAMARAGSEVRQGFGQARSGGTV